MTSKMIPIEAIAKRVEIELLSLTILNKTLYAKVDIVLSSKLASWL
jgi:hypothetical protein